MRLREADLNHLHRNKGWLRLLDSVQQLRFIPYHTIAERDALDAPVCKEAGVQLLIQHY